MVKHTFEGHVFPGHRSQFVSDGRGPNLYLAILVLKLYLAALAN